MKKFIAIFFIIIVIFFCLIVFLNIPATTAQCINYNCRIITIPLYLKGLDFFERHYNYAFLAKEIAKDSKNSRERLMRIFEWAYSNIRPVPDGLPVVDDHAWHIIIRGYGTDDQVQDVFTTLCNYNGINAFFDYVYGKHENDKKYLSFAKINDKWFVFDAGNGVYFVNNRGDFASTGEILKGDWKPVSLSSGSRPFDYAPYFKNLKSVNCNDWYLMRAALQSPLRRLMFWIRKEIPSPFRGGGHK